MQRKAFFAYGVANHVMFLGVYAWMAGFVGNFLVPRSIDNAIQSPIGWAIAINLGLIALFGLQHSIMARPSFKKVWTRIIPQPIERSTYMLATNLVVVLLLWQWRSIETVVWHVEGTVGRTILWSLFATGWLAVPLVTLLINHFDLFGLRQVWMHLKGQKYEHLPFRVPSVYKKVRHPLYVGWIIAFWATPTMTVGHLLFAAGMTAYILIAIRFEERNLVDHFGPAYEEYRKRVPKLIPRFGKSVRNETDVLDPVAPAA